MSRSSMLWSSIALALVLAACGGDSGTAEEPTNTAGEPSATSSVDSSDSKTESSPVANTEGTRDPSELTEAPEDVAPSPPPGGTTPGEQPPVDPDPGEPLPALQDPKVPRGLEALVAAARADLAATLAVGEADIGVAIAETIVWPDGSIGCPEPEMAYTQVQVEGFRIVLTNGGSSYTYHGGGSRPDPFLCRNPNFPSN